MTSLHLSQTRKWLLSSPPIEWAVSRLRELLIGALRQGPIPQHVAFIMDGNRRFARRSHIETVEGHNLGFEALARVCFVSPAVRCEPRIGKELTRQLRTDPGSLLQIR